MSSDLQAHPPGLLFFSLLPLTCPSSFLPFSFETGLHYIAQVGLELTTLLPQFLITDITTEYSLTLAFVGWFS